MVDMVVIEQTLVNIEAHVDLDFHSILLGVMLQPGSRIGSYAYRYLCNTSSRVNLDYLQPLDGPVGRSFTFITEGGRAQLLYQRRQDGSSGCRAHP